jgi:hypothetical protein
MSPLMARPLRLEYPGAVYHVIARGNNRQAIFADDRDHTIYLQKWQRPDFLPSFPPPTFHPLLFSPSLAAATQLEHGPGGSLPSRPAGTPDSGEIRSVFATRTLAPGHVPGLLPPPPAFGCTQRSG